MWSLKVLCEVLKRYVDFKVLKCYVNFAINKY
jgi:hypothetical protein